MVDKKYKIVFDMSDGTTKEAIFTLPLGTDGTMWYFTALDKPSNVTVKPGDVHLSTTTGKISVCTSDDGTFVDVYTIPSGGGGTKWYYGTAVLPSNSDIKVGDFYLCTTSGVVSVCTSAEGYGTFKEVFSIKGESGTSTSGDGGTKWHYGTVITGTGSSIMQPSGTGAKTGDFYLNTNTGNVYVSTNGETWWKYLMCIKGTSSDVYTKSEIDAIMGSYITDISTLIGGDV